MLNYGAGLNRQSAFNITLNLAFFVTIAFFTFYQLSLPLWHDEIYQLWMISKDFDSIIATTRADPNYPLQSIIYKLFYDWNISKNFENLVFIHFFSLFIIFFSFFLLKKALSYKKILMFAFILFSSEYFLRFFFELRSYGFVFSWSVLFSSSYFLSTKFKDDDLYLYLLFLTGIVLSAFHAIAGLFVVSVMLKFLIENNSALKRSIALILIITSTLFVIIFSSESVLENNNFHINSYFNHIRNTGAFMIPLLVAGIFILIGITKETFKKILFDISPIIFSIVVIFTYSIITSPFYQARYFVSFFPFLSLFLVHHLDLKHFLNLKIASILFIVFLYGPRAVTPYTNFEGIIENSHVAECNGVPLFVENQTGFDSKTIFQSEFHRIVYFTAEEYYSDIQRPVFSAKDTVIWWNSNHQNNDCKVVGVSIENIISDFGTLLEGKNTIDLSKKLVDGCIENECGVIWNKE